MELPIDRLRMRLLPYQSHPSMIGINEVGHVPVTSEFVRDLVDCLVSEDISVIRSGLFYCLGLFAAGKWAEFGSNLQEILKANLPVWILHPEPKVRGSAVPLYIELRAYLPQYRNQLKECLQDSDSEVRQCALHYTETFLKAMEVTPLLHFLNDPYAAESEMGGHLTYVLRNMALERIEGLIDRRFAKSELCETVDGELFFWWDWSQFLAWWKANSNEH